MCRLVNQDARFLPKLRQADEGLINHWRSLGIIQSSAWERGLFRRNRYGYSLLAADFVILGLALTKFTGARPMEKIATLFEAAIPEHFKTVRELLAFYEEETDYAKFLRKLLDRGVKLRGDIAAGAASSEST